MNNSEVDIQKQTYQRIIIPVDGSDYSKKAAKIGSFIARRTETPLILFHVKEIPATAVPPGEVTYAPNLSETLDEHGKNLLKEIKDICDCEDLDIQTELVEGIPHNEIVDFATKKDLIIMGSKGHSAIERIFIGSTSENVLHHSDSSVMIVR